jgi:RNA polymerase primary sigma factor
LVANDNIRNFTLSFILEELDIVVSEVIPDADNLVVESGAKAQSTSAEAAVAALAALDSEFGRTTDPVRMYMREMGVVDLLEQEDEIRIAKEIESGIFEILQAITLYPSITEHFFKAHTRLEEGKCKITDVIIGYQNDAQDFAKKKEAFDAGEFDDDEYADMEEMEYTGPDEEQVYVRFNKVSKLSEIYQNTNQECGFPYKQAFCTTFSCFFTSKTRSQMVSIIAVTNFGAKRKSDKLVDNFSRAVMVFSWRKPHS